MQRALEVISESPEETRILGASLAPTLVPGDVISLGGDLGAGKTTFVQGLGAALGVDQVITSPTFTLVHEYIGRYLLVHVDVYRLNSFQEVIDLGFEELADPGAILIVEWGDAVLPFLPMRYLEISLRRLDDAEALTQRRISYRAHGPDWVHKLGAMRDAAEALLDAASLEISGGHRFQES